MSKNQLAADPPPKAGTIIIDPTNREDNEFRVTIEGGPFLGSTYEIQLSFEGVSGETSSFWTEIDDERIIKTPSVIESNYILEAKNANATNATVTWVEPSFPASSGRVQWGGEPIADTFIDTTPVKEGLFSKIGSFFRRIFGGK